MLKDILDNHHINVTDLLRQSEMKKVNDIEEKSTTTEDTYTPISNGCLTSIRKTGTTYRGNEILLCKCTCGNEVETTKNDLITVKHRFCSKSCGNRKNRKNQEDTKVILSDDWSQKIRCTLAVGDILERKETKRDGVRYVCNTYKCKCMKCGKEHLFSDLDFKIKDGYSIAKCNCYKHSKLQWNVVEILEKYNVKYIAEFVIPTVDKYRYDFAIFTDDMKYVRYLVECHGEQHYCPSKDFGGMDGYFRQRVIDLDKMEQAKAGGYSLIIIPFTIGYDKNYVEHLLRRFNIIKDEI